MTLAVGNDHKFYYNSGTAGSPVWVQISIVGNVNMTLGCNNAEVDLRLSNWITNLPAKLTGELPFTLAAHVGNAVWAVLRAAYFARTKIQYAVANAAIATTATEYFKGFMHFSAFPWNQPTQEMASGEAVLSLSYYEESNQVVDPSWTIVS